MSVTTLKLSNILSDYPLRNSGDILKVVARTWNRDSHDLFDYEANQLSADQFRVITRSVELLRRGNDVVVSPSDEPAPLDAEYLASVRYDKLTGQYVISSRESPYLHSSISGKKLWSVIRENHPRGVRLVEGDMVKLGRFRLRVRQICLSDSMSDDNTSCSSYGETSPVADDEAMEDTTLSGSSAKKKVSMGRRGSSGEFSMPDLRIGSLNSAIAQAFGTETAEQEPALKQLQCRICLSEGPCEEDPLICPCECTGSIGYVHADCIGRWLRGRLGLENHTKQAFFYRPVACELCHATYPAYWSLDGGQTLEPVAHLPEVKAPYIVFENMGGSVTVPGWSNDSSNSFPHGLHVVGLASPAGVRIGRGHDCDMRISDVSISRLHALVRLGEDGHVYLHDQQSKFGTLIALDNRDARPRPIVVPVGQNQPIISIQCGRTVLSFSTAPAGGETDGDSVHSTFNDESEIAAADELDDSREVADEGDVASPIGRPNTN